MLYFVRFPYQLLWSIFAFILLIQSCKGPDGPTGPQGDSGVTGSTGAKGSQGDTGTPNVVYTDWKTYTWQVGGNGAAEFSSYSLTTPSNTNAIFTKEAISTAAIFTYIKYAAIVDSVLKVANGSAVYTGKYTLTQRITSDQSVSHYYKIPGRTNATALDYGFSYVNSGGVSENFFSPTIQVNTFSLGQSIPDLKNKSADFVRGLVKDLPQFRHVIVYGGVKNGRLAAINWHNYEEVKQALHLAD